MIFIPVLILIHLFLLFHFQFTAWPEMFSYPYLLNNGFNLYKDIALPYQPLLPLILANVYNFFGYNLSTLQSFTWFLIILSDVLIFLISLKTFGKKLISLVPLILFIPLQTFSDGNMLWFDLATLPFILSGILAYVYLNGLKRYFWLGFFLSAAFFIKQQTGISILFLVIAFLYKKYFRELLFFFLGSIPLIIFVSFYIFSNRIISDYIFWTFTVPLYWYPKFPGYTNLPQYKDLIIILLIFLPGIYLTRRSIEKNDDRFYISSFLLLGAFASAFPRFEYFRFQPAIALYIVVLILVLSKTRQRIVLLIPIVLASVLLLKNNLSALDQPVRFYGKKEINLSRSIATISRPNEKIFILNDSSLSYVLSNRLPPKPWVDNYVWYLEIAGMQDKVIQGLINDQPAIVFRKSPLAGNRYDLGTYEPKSIVYYIEQNYRKSGMIDDIEIWKKD